MPVVKISTALGTPPKAVEKVQTSISVDRELYDFIKQEADEHGRSVNAEIVFRLCSTKGKKFVVKVVEE